MLIGLITRCLLIIIMSLLIFTYGIVSKKYNMREILIICVYVVSTFIYLFTNNIYVMILFGFISTISVFKIIDIIDGFVNGLSPTRGMIVGRFQPLHIGHKHIINNALDIVDVLYICIGSYDKSKTQRNPLSGKERYDMFYNSEFRDYIDNGRIVIIPVNDLHGEQNNNTDWGDYLMDIVKGYTNGYDIDIMFGGEEVCRNNWFSEEQSKNMKFVDVSKGEVPISATQIRSMVANNEDVSEYLPISDVWRDYVISKLNITYK